MLGQILQFLLEITFTLFGVGLLVRAWMNSIRMPRFNPLALAIHRYTDSRARAAPQTSRLARTGRDLAGGAAVHRSELGRERRFAACGGVRFTVSGRCAVDGPALDVESGGVVDFDSSHIDMGEPASTADAAAVYAHRPHLGSHPSGATAYRYRFLAAGRPDSGADRHYRVEPNQPESVRFLKPWPKLES